MSDRRPIGYEYVPEAGPRRAVIFHPRNAGGWDRVTYEYRCGGWAPIDSEIVAQLEIGEVGPAVESETGP